MKIQDLFADGIDWKVGMGDKTRYGISDPSGIIELIRKRDQDVTGITYNYTSFAEYSLDVAAILKKDFKDKLIVIGGAHASMDAEDLLRNSSSEQTREIVDYAIRRYNEH